ncbi:MAG: class I SAM-dependent methyltransferase [Calditrichaeota bacterium]|nr:class I SAM-dependent methyltransferase [Calditrichota bacterium]
MNHQERIDFIREGIQTLSGNWADFGSGTGLFTHAIAEILDTRATIFSIDKSRSSLHKQEQKFNGMQNIPSIHFLYRDFTGSLSLPPLKGIIMANALHYIEAKAELISKFLNYLKENGRFILVEYNIVRGNS